LLGVVVAFKVVHMLAVKDFLCDVDCGLHCITDFMDAVLEMTFGVIPLSPFIWLP
jgi:hypothetical protein